MSHYAYLILLFSPPVATLIGALYWRYYRQGPTSSRFIERVPSHPVPPLVAHFRKHRDCPDCRGVLLDGPSGGMTQNMKCENCGHKFNLGFADGSVFYAARLL